MPRDRVGDRETVTLALALIESIGVEARNEVFLLYAIFYRYFRSVLQCAISLNFSRAECGEESPDDRSCCLQLLKRRVARTYTIAPPTYSVHVYRIG